MDSSGWIASFHLSRKLRGKALANTDSNLWPFSGVNQQNGMDLSHMHPDERAHIEDMQAKANQVQQQQQPQLQQQPPHLQHTDPMMMDQQQMQQPPMKQ